MHFHSGKVPLRHAAKMRAKLQQAHERMPYESHPAHIGGPGAGSAW